LIVVVGDMFSEEIRTRLERLPHRLIDLSGLLVTAHLREEMVDEWHAELDFVLRRTNGRPLTRLWRGTRYALSILGIVPNLEGGKRPRDRVLAWLSATVAILLAATSWLMLGYGGKWSGFGELIYGFRQLAHPVTAADYWIIPNDIGNVLSGLGLIPMAIAFAGAAYIGVANPRFARAKFYLFRMAVVGIGVLFLGGDLESVASLGLQPLKGYLIAFDVVGPIFTVVPVLTIRKVSKARFLAYHNEMAARPLEAPDSNKA